MPAPLPPPRGTEELSHFPVAFSVGALNLRRGSQSDQHGCQCRGINDHTRMSLRENGVILIFAIGGVALAAALEQAQDVLVTEVPAAIALAQVAAERAHVAN